VPQASAVPVAHRPASWLRRRSPGGAAGDVARGSQCGAASALCPGNRPCGKDAWSSVGPGTTLG